MATANDDSIPQYPPPQHPYYYPPQSAAGSSSEGANNDRHVRYADEGVIPARPRSREQPAQRIGGGRSGRRAGTGTSTGSSLGISIFRNKNKEKRNGKKKSNVVVDDSASDDEPQPPPVRKKPVEEIAYRGQAGGSRSGRGLSIPIPISRSTDKSKSKFKGKGISSPTGFDEGSETGSMLSIGLGVPAEQWERERGISPLSKRTFSPGTLHSLRSQPIHSLPILGTASRAGSSSMTSSSGSRLDAWSEEDEEEDNIRSESREGMRASPDRGSDETFRRHHPPPHYSTIQAPSVDPRLYGGMNKRGGVRPLPLRPESPMLSPSSNSPSSPQSSSPASTITARAWPMPPRPAYAQSVSSGSSSSMPPTPPTHPLDLYSRSGRSKSPGPVHGLGLSTSPPMVPWGASGLGTRSEGSLHNPTVEIPGNIGRNSNEPGVVSGVVSGVDAAGRPYQYTYQYQSSSGAPPNHGELMAALAPSQHLHASPIYPSPPPTALPPRFPQPPTQPPPQQPTGPKPPQRSVPKRLVVSGIGAPGADDVQFDFDRALNEMHLVGSGDDKSDEGHGGGDGNDSDVDPALSQTRDNQRQSRGRGRGGAKSPGDQRQRPDRDREEAVIQWCRGFGEVLEVRRRGQGCLMVEFLKEGVVDFICRSQQVYIKGAGKVDLGWC